MYFIKNRDMRKYETLKERLLCAQYRGADKSLALPGWKQNHVSVKMA